MKDQNIVQQFESEQDFIDSNVTCPEGQERFSGVVYAVEFGDYVKVGCTADVNHRFTALSNIARNYAMTSIGRIAITGFCNNWYECEAEAHAMLADYRINDSEMFSVDFDVAVDALKKLHLNLVGPITPQEIEEREKISEEMKDWFRQALQFDERTDPLTYVCASFHQMLKKVFSTSSNLVEIYAFSNDEEDKNMALFALGINAISWEALCLLNGDKDAESAVKTICDEDAFLTWMNGLAHKEINDFVDD